MQSGEYKSCNIRVLLVVQNAHKNCTEYIFLKIWLLIPDWLSCILYPWVYSTLVERAAELSSVCTENPLLILMVTPLKIILTSDQNCASCTGYSRIQSRNTLVLNSKRTTPVQPLTPVDGTVQYKSNNL